MFTVFCIYSFIYNVSSKPLRNNLSYTVYAIIYYVFRSKSLTKDSPRKFKIPLAMKLKLERDNSNEENEPAIIDIDIKQMEDSINILQQLPQRLV